MAATFGPWRITPSQQGGIADESLLGDNRAIRVFQDGDILFDGAIDAVEGILTQGAPPTLTVRAGSVPAGFRDIPKSRGFRNMTDAEVFRMLAGEHGLNLQIALLARPLPAPPQENETDYAYVVRRGAQIHADVWLRERILQVFDRRQGKRPVVGLAYGSGLLDLTGTLSAPQPPSTWKEAAKHAAGTAAGNAKIVAGTGLSITGAGERFSGAYVATRVTHTFDLQAGFRSSFSAVEAS